MPDIQLGLWDNDKLVGSNPRMMHRYLIFDHILGNIWEVSAKNKGNAHVICNLNSDHTDIVCIGLKPLLTRAVNHGRAHDLWLTHKSDRR